jgi:hypothetical protein
VRLQLQRLGENLEVTMFYDKIRNLRPSVFE